MEFVYQEYKLNQVHLLHRFRSPAKIAINKRAWTDGNKYSLFWIEQRNVNKTAVSKRISLKWGSRQSLSAYCSFMFCSHKFQRVIRILFQPKMREEIKTMQISCVYFRKFSDFKLYFIFEVTFWDPASNIYVKITD